MKKIRLFLPAMAVVLAFGAALASTAEKATAFALIPVDDTRISGCANNKTCDTTQTPEDCSANYVEFKTSNSTCLSAVSGKIQ